MILRPLFSTRGTVSPVTDGARSALQSGSADETRARLCTSRLILALLIVIAAVLRFLFLARKSFWLDEGVSVEIARFNWYNFARILWWREGNMTLYYLLLRGWLHLGHSEFFIRSLSVLPSLATLPALYWLGSRLFDRRVALIAVTLLTFNAYDVCYAQEARSYSLFVFLCTLSSGFFVACVRKPSRANRLGHIVTSGLSVYAHFYASLLIATQWLCLRFLSRDEIDPRLSRNWRWIALLLFPALLFVGGTGAGPINWIQRPGFKELYEYYGRLTGNGGPLLVFAYGLAGAAAFVPPTVRQLRRTLPWPAWRYLFLLMWLFFPVACTVVVSVLRPIFLPRYFIFCLPALLLLAAAGLANLRPKWLLAPALVVFVALSFRGVLSYYQQDFDLNRDDWRTATYYVLDHARPGDAVLFHIAIGRMPYDFYQSVFPRLSATPHIIYPAYGDHLDFREVMRRPATGFLRTIPSQYDRVWVVLKNNATPNGSDPTIQTFNQVFGESYANGSTQSFPGVEVRLYSKR